MCWSQRLCVWGRYTVFHCQMLCSSFCHDTTMTFGNFTATMDSINGSGLENVTGTSSFSDEIDDIRYQIIDALKIYAPPVLLFFGTFGNMLSFLVFSQASLRKSAAAFYFRVLAVADTLALNVGLWPNWMRDAFGIYLWPSTDAACRIQIYLKYTLPDCAVWVLLIMTIERLLSVQRLSPRRVLTRTRIRSSVVVMVIFISALNIPSLWILTKNEDPATGLTCTVDSMRLAYDIWPWVDLTLYCLLPASVMMACNVVIIRTVLRRQERLSIGGVISIYVGHRPRRLTSMTVTLLAVTAVFFLLTAPFVIYAITIANIVSSHPSLHLWYFVSSYLRYINNSINFPVYCMSGRPFRQELMHLIRRDGLDRRGQYSHAGSSRVVIHEGRGSVCSQSGNVILKMRKISPVVAKITKQKSMV